MLIFNQNNTFFYNQFVRQFECPIAKSNSLLPFQFKLSGSSLQIQKIYLQNADVQIDITNVIKPYIQIYSEIGTLNKYFIYKGGASVGDYCGIAQLYIEFNEVELYSNFFVLTSETLKYIKFANQKDLNGRIFQNGYADYLYFKSKNFKIIEPFVYEVAKEVGDGMQKVEYSKLYKQYEIKLSADFQVVKMLNEFIVYDNIEVSRDNEWAELEGVAKPMPEKVAKVILKFTFNENTRFYDVVITLQIADIEKVNCAENLDIEIIENETTVLAFADEVIATASGIDVIVIENNN